MYSDGERWQNGNGTMEAFKLLSKSSGLRRQTNFMPKRVVGLAHFRAASESFRFLAFTSLHNSNSLPMSTFRNVNSLDAHGATINNVGRDQINVNQVNFNFKVRYDAIHALSLYILTCI